ncbi:MAG: glycosyltransferase, partial [Deltaproteobacteria bacterium]|nr:glycosyltransferase [Deltaproteobacteria bacterium]
HARGRWIAIQDSDDICLPDQLEFLLDYAEKNPHLGMVFANGAYLGGPEHKRDTIIPREKSARLARDGVRLVDLFEKSIVRLQAALISRESFLAIGGLDEELRICMDLDLSFRLFMRYPVAHLDRVVFLYRKHGGNIGQGSFPRRKGRWVRGGLPGARPTGIIALPKGGGRTAIGRGPRRP